ncbi:MAG: CRISPR-associated endoribonuclease Cas6, partial [Candidatus Nanoarchaeia archaeon]
MRILLNLKTTKNFSYDKNYFHKLEGFVYSFLKDTPLSILHDKKSYKFFCFSNIFPLPKENLEIKSEEIKNLIISSPSSL